MLSLFNPDMQMVWCQDRAECILGRYPTLLQLKKVYGQNVVESLIEIQLNDLNKFSNVREKMSIEQLDSTARVIIINYPSMKVTELLLFFVMLKGGKYGKFYGAVDGMAITDALHRHEQWLYIMRRELPHDISMSAELQRIEERKQKILLTDNKRNIGYERNK